MVNAVLVVETLHATSLPPHLFVLFVLFVVPARTLPSESFWERGLGRGLWQHQSAMLCDLPLKAGGTPPRKEGAGVFVASPQKHQPPLHSILSSTVPPVCLYPLAFAVQTHRADKQRHP
jgi:hypothetical protein